MPVVEIDDEPVRREPQRRRQLTFDLALAPDYRATSFHVTDSNADAHAMVTMWPNWPHPALLITGPAGAGKTHLLHVWAAAAQARLIDADSLSQSPPAELARSAALALDDADRVAQVAEAPLFHLFNLMRESGGSLLLAARSPPDRWGLAIPDLLSRLRLATHVAIAAPDDALMRHVLVKLFRDRQLAIDPDIVDYIALRIPRSLGAVRAITAELDAEALALGAKITRALALRVIEAFERCSDAD